MYMIKPPFEGGKFCYVPNNQGKPAKIRLPPLSRTRAGFTGRDSGTGACRRPGAVIFGSGLTPLALVALTFPFVIPDKAVFIATILASILAIVLMAPGSVPHFFASAFALVLAHQSFFTAAFPAVVAFVVPAHFDYVITCQRGELCGGKQQSCNRESYT